LRVLVVEPGVKIEIDFSSKKEEKK